jgi:hypothetical protein
LWCILPTGVGAPDLFTTFLGRYTACLKKSPIHKFRAYLLLRLGNPLALKELFYGYKGLQAASKGL